MAYPSPATSFSEIEIESPAPPPYHPPSANDFVASTSQIAMAYPSPATSFSEIEIESPAPPPYHPPSANDFEASTSASTADDINVKSSKYYGRDVFINHRGPDVKKTFASHLYYRLRDHGVEAFLDIQEMQEGEDISAQIKDAIATAAVHVAIFSPGYAESSWCLNELVDMLESKAPIIPVFYNVKPGDLRGKDGVYAKAIRELEKKPRHSSNTIENWREALATVSKISGFEVDACNGDEGVLLEKLVELLLKMVKNKEKEVFVADYPTGLDEKLKHFERFLCELPENKPKVAGIVGLGGIGKTTLAKELFNRRSSRYRKSCFLFDVKHAAKSGGSSLVGLQKKLLQRLLRFDAKIDSIDEGKRLLIKHLQSFSHSCMLIFDDVDHVDQLDALLPDEVKYTFPSYCLILITSRDKNVLLRSRIQDSSIYKLSGLNRKHSMELFCRHAFCQPNPLPGFQNLLESILRICDGLPFSLKVLGSQFRVNSDNTYWEGILSRVHGLPDIKKTLRISYDSLNEEEKHMFLYISCFLIGEKRDTAIKIWDQSAGKCFVFQNLQNKSLVEVDSENCIHMHDHLRELGRESAESSGFHNPRLWDRTENDIAVLLRMLKQSTNRDVLGIRMVPSADVGHELKSYASLQSDMSWFKRRTHELLGKRMMKLSNRWHKTLYPGITMTHLHLLVTEDHLLERILRTVALPNLRWLRWYKCGHSSLPSWIPMENLRVLYVVGNALKTLWQDKAQAPLQLRELEILAPLSKFPKSIRRLKHLEQIYISLPEQNNMSSLPEEFCELLSLKRFELINAWKMKSLPDSIGNLVKLEYLNLSGSRNLERLPDSFEDLICLKYLDLRGTDNLIISTRNHGNIPWGRLAGRVGHHGNIPSETLAATVGGWLKLHACRRMEREKSEKEETRERKKAEERDLWEEREEDERREWEEGRKERKARMEKERQMEYRLWVRLDWDKWDGLEREWERKWWECRRQYWFKSVERPSGWRALMEWEERVWKEWRADSETKPEVWWKMEWAQARVRRDQHAWWFKLFWRHLKEGEQAQGAVMMNPRPSPLQLPRSLQELHIAELPLSFENLCNLEILELDGSLSKMLPPSPSDLRNLKELRLVDCPRWKCLPDSLGPLTVLEVKRCRGLVEVGTLPSTLIQLGIISCPNLEKIDGLCGLAKLQTLNISGWRKVEELAGIETLVSLEQLRASGCEKLKRIHGLWQLTKLKLLDVHGCREIEELEGVEHLRSVEMLDASDCPRLHWHARVLEQLPQRLKEGMLYI